MEAGLDETFVRCATSGLETPDESRQPLTKPGPFMDNLLEFFASMPSWQRSFLLIGGIVALWFAEGMRPMVALSSRSRHAMINLALTVLQLVVGLAFAALIVLAADFTTVSSFGLLYQVALPLWAHVVLGVLFLDFFAAYLIHYVEHKIRWMWRFHLVHHSDTHIDVTTGLRHHPGETVIRSTAILGAVLLLGIPIGVFVLYQTLSVLFAQIEHANIRVPDGIDRLLSLVIVTPNMHKVHHHFEQPLTDTNYGNIFSIWDRVFGTFAYAAPESLTYGIDTHMKPAEHSRLVNLLSMPFRELRSPSSNELHRAVDDKMKSREGEGK